MIDSFTVRLEAKNSSSGLPTSSCNGKVVRSSLFPKIDAKNIDREVQPKRSSFSGKMKLQSLSCTPNFQVRVVN